MTAQIHKRLIDDQVKMILDRFIKNEPSPGQAMDLLGLKRSQFFEWMEKYRESGGKPLRFSIIVQVFFSFSRSPLWGTD